MAVSADRLTQALGTTKETGAFAPRHMLAVERIQDQLGLDYTQCVPDVLVACGLGAATADSAAVCSRRFGEQKCRPRVVALHGQAALRLATRAGLIHDRAFGPVGIEPVPFVVVDDQTLDLTELAAALERQWTAPQPRLVEPVPLGLELAMLDALGAHKGHRRLVQQRNGGRAWKTQVGGPRVQEAARVSSETSSSCCKLTPEVVARHLAGNEPAAAFMPRGQWPFVVIDIDLHNALQLDCFDDTFKTARLQFKDALFVRSSDSCGLHVYLPLPTGTQYGEAAIIMRTWLALNGWRWSERESSTGQKVRAELMEVPEHPPRLPFGPGSWIVRPSAYRKGLRDELLRPKTIDIDQEVEEWRRFVGQTPATTFTRARDEVQQAFGMKLTRPDNGARDAGSEPTPPVDTAQPPTPVRPPKQLWTAGKRKTLTDWLSDDEVAERDERDDVKFALRSPQLDRDDPWYPIVDRWTTGKLAAHVTGRFPTSLSRVAAGGVPAFGTRTRWMMALVDALVLTVPIEQVEPLMLHWLRERRHNSENIAIDPLGVEEQLKKIVKEARKKQVPERIWKMVERKILQARERTGAVSIVREMQVEDLLQNSFCLLAAFYKKKRWSDRYEWRAELSHWDFSAFVGRNRAHDVQQFHTFEAQWLYCKSKAAPGVRARRFSLNLVDWRRRAGEVMVNVPHLDLRTP